MTHGEGESIPVYDDFRQARRDPDISAPPTVAPESLVVEPYPGVWVICDEHEKPYLVEHFVKVDNENWVSQMQGPPGTRDLPADPTTGRVRLMRSASTDAFGFVDGNGEWSPNGEGVALAGWTNSHHNLKCSLCERRSRADRDRKLVNVSVRRGALTRILDVLAEHHVSQISLSALAARV